MVIRRSSSDVNSSNEIVDVAKQITDRFYKQPKCFQEVVQCVINRKKPVLEHSWGTHI